MVWREEVGPKWEEKGQPKQMGLTARPQVSHYERTSISTEAIIGYCEASPPRLHIRAQADSAPPTQTRVSCDVHVPSSPEFRGGV